MIDLAVLFDVAPFDWHNIGTAILCGTMIGLERQIRGKPVGIRTASLITLGTYIFLSTSYMLQGQVVDPSRVLGQVITGIGFIGAGVMLARDGSVMGVTSAATIWVLAAIGVMIASDYLSAAIKLSILVVIILLGIDYFEQSMKSVSRGVHTKVKRTFAKRRQSRHRHFKKVEKSEEKG